MFPRWLCIMAMHHCYVSWLCIMAMYHGYVPWLCILAMYHDYVSWLCIMAMHHGYVSRLCIMAMYHGYVYYFIYIVYYKKRQQRIQEGQFLKSVLNLVLIADSESTQKSVQDRTGIIDLQNDFNIFVAKQWKIIISIPISYIRFWE